MSGFKIVDLAGPPPAPKIPGAMYGIPKVALSSCTIKAVMVPWSLTVVSVGSSWMRRKISRPGDSAAPVELVKKNFVRWFDGEFDELDSYSHTTINGKAWGRTPGGAQHSSDLAINAAVLRFVWALHIELSI